MVTRIDSDRQFNEAIGSGSTCIVFFSATWCGPSKMIKPYFYQLSDEYKSITFLEVDVDELEGVASDAGVSAMPTFMAYRGAKVVDQRVGSSNEKLLQLVKLYS
jgi:thioredoxin 1